MPFPVDIPTVITRARFRELIDPLLDGLNLRAEDIVSCSFDASGFELLVFEQDASAGGRVIASEGYAKQVVRVHIGPEAVGR